jgi:hypothetical protein
MEAGIKLEHLDGRKNHGWLSPFDIEIGTNITEEQLLEEIQLLTQLSSCLNSTFTQEEAGE